MNSSVIPEKPEHLCVADLCGGDRDPERTDSLCDFHGRYRDERFAREAKRAADARALWGYRVLAIVSRSQFVGTWMGTEEDVLMAARHFYPKLPAADRERLGTEP